jgi:aldehyde:ferredoxin oxidoreductase
MTHGYSGNVLRVDLSSNNIWIEHLPDEYYQKYMGGRALIAALLLREIDPGIDPFASENPLIFAPGVVTGYPISGQGRHGVGAKSPLTGRFGNSEAGGFWGASMKQAGFDAIIIKGQARSPVYLLINKGGAEIRDAAHLWGLTTGETQDQLLKDLDNPRIHTALIGPAGENLVRYANIAHDCRHFAGRTGMGAVMGSKKLKGIVVIPGRLLTPMANPTAVHEVSHWLAQNKGLFSFMHDLGTPGDLKGLSLAGGLPTLNFRFGTFEGADSISGERLRDTILVDRGTCFGCIVRCKRIVEVKGEYSTTPRYGGPEYETLAAFGSNLGISNLEVLAKANELCAAYGLDTISTGGTIAFAMECFENGLLTLKDTDGIDLRFGNQHAVLQIIHKIAHREGIGDLLAQGSLRSSKMIGGTAEEYAMHVKGQEIPMHEPRLKRALGVGYGISPTGADHMHNLNDDFYTQDNRFMQKVRAFGEFEPQPIESLSPEKMRLFYYEVNWRHFLDSAVMCYFLPYDYYQIAQIVNGITGWNTDPFELLHVGERAVTLAQIFNCREGFDPDEETLPKRFFQPFITGPIKGAMVDEIAYKTAREYWYQKMDWDPISGWPSAQRLTSLGLNDAIKWLPPSRMAER